jgi:SAM-dependent methyltransferase
LGCGTGKVLIPIARSGVEVYGLDLSKGMLDIAKKKIELLDRKVASRITLIKGDMRNFPISKRFNLIIIPFCSFHLLTTTKDQKKTLRCIRHHLARRGLFILNLVPPQLLARAKNVVKEIETGNGGKIKIAQWGEDDLSESPPLINIHRTYEDLQNDKSKTIAWRETLCYITKEEIENLLTNEGFIVSNIFRDFNKNPYDTQIASDLYFISRLK